MDGVERIGKALFGLRFAIAIFPSQRLVMAAGSSPFEEAEFDRALLDTGSPDALWEGRGALFEAATAGDGKGFSKCLSVCDPSGGGGESPLAGAVGAGREDFAVRLLAAGADVRVEMGGMRVLDVAAAKGMGALCEALSASSPDCELAESIGLAVFYGHVDEALAMVRGSGGRMGASDLFGALERARVSSALHPSMAQRLFEAVCAMEAGDRLAAGVKPAAGGVGGSSPSV